MQARRAARELAFIIFSQFNKQIDKQLKGDLDEILLKSLRILINNASEELKLTTGALIEIKDFIDDYEADHETNLERPLGSSDVPVQIPLTSEMSEKIDKMIEVADKAAAALEISEFATLGASVEVKEYTEKIVEYFAQNAKEVDEIIQKYSKGWDISRLVKMDKDLLRIAITELLYIKEAPMKVVVDESLEVAKKYSTEDSAPFINGILARVISENGLK